MTQPSTRPEKASVAGSVDGTQRTHRPWTDIQFWLAVAAGPLCWWLMIAAGVNARTDPLAWKVVALVAIVSPVLEEIVFRGGLQTALLTRPLLRRACWGITGANLLTSIAFAAVHLISQPPLWALLIVLPSLVFGWALERHNTLLSPIGLHVFYNSGFIILFQ